jgi:zona occludens toxin
MITLFTGSPGAGKTASLVDFLSKLGGDRPLYVDGLNGLTLPHTVCDANNWHNELPDGAILVIDEVQRIWRPRGSATKVPDSVAALETHRHRGIDVYVTTQSPTLVDSNFRNLVGRHVHIRDTGILGRWWYEWPETSTGMNWKTCVNKHRLSLPKKAFQLYKSSSLHTTPVRGIPRALIFGIVALLAFFVLAFMASKAINRSANGGRPPAASTPSGVVASGPAMVPLVVKTGIDDRVDFIPRVSSKPESAPAYDHLRVIVAMPVVAGGVCMGDKCKCYTEQGTDAGLSVADCRVVVAASQFNPYKVSTLPASPVATLAPSFVGIPLANTPPPASPSRASPSIAGR